MKRQITKKEIKNRINENRIFKDAEDVLVFEFCIKENNVKLFRYKVSRTGEYGMGSGVVIRNGEIVCEKKISDTTSDSCYIFINKKNEGGFILNISGTQTQIAKDGDRVTTKKLVTEGKVETDCCTGQIIFAQSNTPPIIRIKEVDESYDLTVSKFNFDLIHEDKSLIFNSMNSAVTISEETKVTKFFSAPMLTVKQEAETIYASSSTNREVIKYNEEGEVVKYKNYLNKIESQINSITGGEEERIFFRGIMVGYKMHKIDGDKEITVRQFFNLVNQCEEAILENGKKVSCQRYLNGHIDKYTYREDGKTIDRHISTAINPDSELKSYFVAFCDGFDYEITNNHQDGIKYFTIKYNDDLLCTINANPNMIFITAYDEIKDKETPSTYLFSISTLFQITKYHNFFNSYSGIEYECIVDVSQFGLCPTGYKDNDFEIEYEYGESGQYTTAKFDSRFLKESEGVYLRDSFGIPRLFKGNYIDDIDSMWFIPLTYLFKEEM